MELRGPINLEGVVQHFDRRSISAERGSGSSYNRKAENSSSSEGSSESETDCSTEVEGVCVVEDFEFNSGNETTILDESREVCNRSFEPESPLPSETFSGTDLTSDSGVGALKTDRMSKNAQGDDPITTTLLLMQQMMK